tara:strand:+ start:7 stop:540 length:534 start_codon:yes stop_codon:yes gene_type:complete
MKVHSTTIQGLLVIEPKVFEDERGKFFESFNQQYFTHNVCETTFVQDNHSVSKKGVLRGIHLQRSPYEQGKLVRVIKGEIYDVAVDLRKNSSTYLKYFSLNLSSANKKQLWIPPGFGHGFLTLSETAEVAYKATNFYSKNSEITIRYDDKEIDINWPTKQNLIISPKDLDGVLSTDL